ncbi:MAG TPA: type II secretion system protein [Candidatus Limnocylindria bacterium]|jgi:prepilin-type processing-associated H-X9-DG protein|nr:type II secretion system protein [Candidatus Limnocylindria bacterium]
MHINRPPMLRRLPGFTLIELLVLGATIAILAGMLLPAFSKTKTQTRGAVCLNNEAQLAHAWHLYAEDSNGVLVRTAALESLVSVVSPTKNYPLNQWCMGTMDRLNVATNQQLIMDSLLYKFVGTLTAYKCPSDQSGWNNGAQKPYGGGQFPSLRSMSMNAWMNPINAWAQDSQKVTSFRRISSVLKPSATFVTIDENPTSINDGWLICDPNSSSWTDLPATYHNNGSSLSFADGHVEIKIWRDRAILGRVGTIGVAPKDGRVDLRWLSVRSTYGLNGPP